MQIGLFDIQNDVVVPDEVAVRILPWMKRIRENFQEDYLKVYAYLFYMSCWDGRNIYLNLADAERESAIVDELEIDFSLDNPVIQVALEKCRKMYETPAVALLRAVKIQISEIAKSLSTTTMTYGKNGNADQLTKLVEKSAQFAEIYDKLDGRLKLEQIKVRGGKEISYDMQSDYKNLKE